MRTATIRSIRWSRWGKWVKRLAAAGALMLLMVAVSVCSTTNPETHNRFVLHVVTPTCDYEMLQNPVMHVGEAKWYSFEREEGCGEPFVGHEWDGQMLQVWVSHLQARRYRHMQVQLGNRIPGAKSWAITNGNRMRIDHSHIFIGTLDMGTPDGTYIPADGIEAAAGLLEDRQSCEGKRWSCGEDWEFADLFTFRSIPGPSQ